MKKSVVAISVVAALAVVWAGGTWYTGKNLEQQYAEKIADLNKTLTQYLPPVDGNGLKVENVSYQRGFFSSKIVDKLVLQDHDQPIELVFESAVQHGPLPLARLRKLELKPVLLAGNAKLVNNSSVATWFKAAKEQTPFSTDFTLDYNEKVVASSRFAALQWVEDNFEFKMSDLVIDSDTDLNAIGNIKLNLDQLSFSEQAAETAQNSTALQINGIKMDSRQQQAKGFENLAVGSSRLTVNDISFDLQPGEQSDDSPLKWQLSDTSIDSEVQLNDGFIDILSKNQLGKLLIDENHFGQFQFDLGIKHLDGKSLNDLVELLKNMPSDGEFTPEQDEQGKQLLQTLMANHPQLQFLPLAWRNDGGTSQLNLDIGFNNIDQVGENMLSLFSKFELSGEVNKQMLCSLLTAVVEMNNPDMTDQGQAQTIDDSYQAASADLLVDGTFIDTPEAFTANLILENGVLKHNGEVVPEEKINEFVMNMVMAAAFYNMSDDDQDNQDDEQWGEDGEIYPDDQLDDSFSPADEGYDLAIPDLSPSDLEGLPEAAPQQ
ncbi:DUF945 domain-containing protein [Pasteurellaceae bacterium USgator11]|nr:DUF945 domain-containing protein [Pasteurellaceae bacterium USgator41]TNG95096.1 DUF945 domain-containing protein [Pasteurellaceae bacterium UScroc12]TNG99097.1 DUF945 domain-containing protein [Pasteurellaceae bacterium USgator11]TNG99936.1 DUF945 domain-containing protein [Pasteurellaceae bacterium UScroc31]